MKAITFFKRVLVSAALASVRGFACATNNGKQFIHNGTVEKRRLVCREIYSMDNLVSGILSPVKMHKYNYNTDRQKMVKSACTWNVFKNAWGKESLTVVSRCETETSVEYPVWNKEREPFSPSGKYICTINSDNQLVAQYTYKMNSYTNQWVLEKDALVPIYKNICITAR